MSLHIAFFNRAFYPEVSATSQLLTELAEGLSRDHGCRVSVVCGMPQGIFPGTWAVPKGWRLLFQERLGEIIILRVRGTTFPKQIFLGRVFNYLTYFGCACFGGMQLKRPDVVVALTDPPVIGLAALLAARRFRSKLIISYRDLFPEVARLLEGFQSPLVEAILNSVNSILIRQADRIVALGHAMRNRLVNEKGAPSEKVVIIPDWVDTAAIAPGPKENPFSQQYGLLDRFVVMHAGNIGVSQNLEVLIEAAKALSHLPNMVFVLIGDGVKKGYLQAKVKMLKLANVLFLPYQPKEELTHVFATADCFVITLKPGLAGYITPSKLYGILAAGRPYVASVDEECDVARISRQYQCGLAARAGDALDVADKIQLLYRDRALCQRMGTNARQAVFAFDRRKGVEAYFKLCQALISSDEG